MNRTAFNSFIFVLGGRYLTAATPWDGHGAGRSEIEFRPGCVMWYNVANKGCQFYDLSQVPDQLVQFSIF